MSQETTAPASTTDVLIRAFIAAFIMPVFFTSPAANHVNWHISTVILFVCFYAAFSLLKNDERILALALILLPLTFVLSLLVSALGEFHLGTDLSYAVFYSITMGLLAIIAAFLWPKESPVGTGAPFRVGEEVLLVVASAQPHDEESPARERTMNALVIEVDEVRAKLRYRDSLGNTSEHWHALDEIRAIEDLERE